MRLFAKSLMVEAKFPQALATGNRMLTHCGAKAHDQAQGREGGRCAFSRWGPCSQKVCSCPFFDCWHLFPQSCSADIPKLPLHAGAPTPPRICCRRRRLSQEQRKDASEGERERVAREQPPHDELRQPRRARRPATTRLLHQPTQHGPCPTQLGQVGRCQHVQSYNANVSVDAP